MQQDGLACEVLVSEPQRTRKGSSAPLLYRLPAPLVLWPAAFEVADGEPTKALIVMCTGISGIDRKRTFVTEKCLSGTSQQIREDVRSMAMGLRIMWVERERAVETLECFLPTMEESECSATSAERPGVIGYDGEGLLVAS